MNRHLPCPVCKTAIPLDLELLARGASMPCPNAGCGAAIGVASESLPAFVRALTAYNRVDALRAPPARLPRS